MDLEFLRARALALYRQGDLAGSELTCRSIIGRAQDSATEQHLLGIILFQQNRLQEALASLDRALQVRPDYVEALVNRGNVLRGLGHLPESLSSYKKALSLRPSDVIALSNSGAVLSELGRLPEAVEACNQALALSPRHVNALATLGNALRRLKQFDDALAVFAKALAIAPASTEARFNRGLTLHDLGRFQEAVRDFDHLIAVNRSDAAALFHRGVALWGVRRFSDALDSFDNALAVDPRYIQAWNSRGVVLSALNRHEDALASFERLLSANPFHVEALNNSGAILLAMGRREEALTAFERACAVNGQYPPALSNRGAALNALGQLDEALASYDAALAIDGNDAGNWNNRAGILRDLVRFDESLASYDRAVSAKSDYAEAWYNRGSVLRDMKLPEESLRSFGMALAINPRLTDALSSRANLLWVTYRDYDKALRDLELAFEINPDYPYLRGDLLHMRMYGGDWRDYDSQVAALDAGVLEGRPMVSPFIYQAISSSPGDLQHCATQYAAHRQPRTAAKPIQRSSHARIRVGYVSGEFRQQATSILAAGLYEAHDRERFEVVAFDSGRRDASPMRSRLEKAFDRFVEIGPLGDDDAAARIRAEEIDILVDLNGYFGEARMGVFARRAAPIQVNYLGYPGTLGANYMDYILADRIVIPETERAFFSEQVVYLPDSYQANDSRRVSGAATPSRPACGLPETCFVFCNFNQSYKLTPLTFTSWMKILRQVEGSVLWLLEGNQDFARNLRREAANCGIAPERLVFAPSLPLEHHLARHSNADLFLDSLPYNAHTTASDALWAGLPLVTCRGSAFAGRVAASLLHAIGLPQLVTENLEQYETLSVKLARDPHLLDNVRRTLRENRKHAPLFDTDRYRRHIETAYCMMWEVHQQGKPPRGFSV